MVAARPYAGRIDVAEIEPAMIPGIEAGIAKGLREARVEWEEALDRTRVFCVSKVKHDLLMWSHYADCHRGAVIALRPLSDRGALRGVQPVRYLPGLPAMGTLEEWVDFILWDAPLDLPGYFQALAYTKSVHWEYEQEWRCRITDADPARDVPGIQAWDCPLAQEEVAAVYLGCRIDPRDRARIVELVRDTMPGVELYDAKRSTSSFSLEFGPVPPGP